MSEINRVFIGYDPRISVSYTVAQHSIVTSAASPVSITPLILEQLPIERQGLTAFTYSRFLVPFLCNYEGWALFVDPDIIVVDDVNKIFEMADDKYDVMVPDVDIPFERAAVILFNCAKCKDLTPQSITDHDDLHRMGWAKNLGKLPKRWNHLVGYDEPTTDVSLIHYTQGIPAFEEIGACEFAQEWMWEYKFANTLPDYHAFMGHSVHVKEDGAPLLAPEPEYKRVVSSNNGTL